MCEKWPQETSEMHHNKENPDDNEENWHRKFNDTDADDDGGQCHSTLHRLRSTAQLSVRTKSCSLHISSHIWLKFESCTFFTPFLPCTRVVVFL